MRIVRRLRSWVTRCGAASVDRVAERLRALLDGGYRVDRRPQVGEHQALRACASRAASPACRAERWIGAGMSSCRYVASESTRSAPGAERLDAPLGAGVGGVDQPLAVVRDLDRERGRRVVGAREAQVDVADRRACRRRRRRASRTCRPSRRPATSSSFSSPSGAYTGRPRARGRSVAARAGRRCRRSGRGGRG